MNTVDLRLIGKLVVDFLFVLIELFSLGVTAEAFLKGVSHFRPNFHVEGDIHHQPFFARIDTSVYALQRCC